MEVILLERIEKIGKLGDVVKVKDGFARNYLLPKIKLFVQIKKIYQFMKREKKSTKN